MRRLYRDLTFQEVMNAISAKQSIDFEVEVNKTSVQSEEEMQKVKDYPGTEWPPINQKDELLKIVPFLNSDTDDNKWQAIVIKTYLNDGTIHYRLTDNDEIYIIGIHF